MERVRLNRLFGRAFAVAALCAIAAQLACGGSSTATHREATTAKRPPPSARGGGPLPLTTAVEMLTTERCAQEGACDRLGPGRRFRDNESCENALVHEARTQLDTTVCETGFVEPSSLFECLESIRAGGCKVQQTVACEPSSLCSP